MFSGKSCLCCFPSYMHNANQDLLIHFFICDDDDDNNNMNKTSAGQYRKRQISKIKLPIISSTVHVYI